MGIPATERQKAYIKRAEELGFKQVNLRVPQERVAEIKELARRMCEEVCQTKDGHPINPSHQKS